MQTPNGLNSDGDDTGDDHDGRDVRDVTIVLVVFVVVVAIVPEARQPSVGVHTNKLPGIHFLVFFTLLSWFSLGSWELEVGS